VRRLVVCGSASPCPPCARRKVAPAARRHGRPSSGQVSALGMGRSSEGGPRLCIEPASSLSQSGGREGVSPVLLGPESLTTSLDLRARPPAKVNDSVREEGKSRKQGARCLPVSHWKRRRTTLHARRGRASAAALHMA